MGRSSPTFRKGTSRPKKLKAIDTLNDFYGLGTGEESAIKELAEYCEIKGIGKDSDIEAFVVREIDHIARKPENKPNFYDKTFFSFENTTDSFSPSLQHKEIDVWSSKKGYIFPEGKKC